jgi:fatty acid desaturase
VSTSYYRRVLYTTELLTRDFIRDKSPPVRMAAWFLATLLILLVWAGYTGWWLMYVCWCTFVGLWRVPLRLTKLRRAYVQEELLATEREQLRLLREMERRGRR